MRWIAIVLAVALFGCAVKEVPVQPTECMTAPEYMGRPDRAFLDYTEESREFFEERAPAPPKPVFYPMSPSTPTFEERPAAAPPPPPPPRPRPAPPRGGPDPIVMSPDEEISVRAGSARVLVPRKMTIGSRYLVRLSVNPDGEGGDVLASEGDRRIATSNEMQAKLHAPDFEVVEIGNAVQKVDPRLGPTVWEWDVIPRKSGSRLITVKLSMILPTRKDLPSMEETILVDSSAWYSISAALSQHGGTILSRVLDWIPQILASVAAGASGVYVMIRHRRRKKQKEEGTA